VVGRTVVGGTVVRGTVVRGTVVVDSVVGGAVVDLGTAGVVVREAAGVLWVQAVPSSEPTTVPAITNLLARITTSPSG